jgi:hypothetical protein
VRAMAAKEAGDRAPRASSISSSPTIMSTGKRHSAPECRPEWRSRISDSFRLLGIRRPNRPLKLQLPPANNVAYGVILDDCASQ